MSVFCSRSHSYFQWQSRDQKPKSLGFQSRTLSNTTNSSEVFLFVFPSSKFLEVKHSFGDQTWSLLHFNIWPMEQFGSRRGGGRGRKSHSSIPEFSCPRKSQYLKPLAAIYTLKALNSFFQSLLALTSLNYIGFVLIPKGLFVNTELWNKRRRKSTFKAKEKNIHLTVWKVRSTLMGAGLLGERKEATGTFEDLGSTFHGTISMIMISLW